MSSEAKLGWAALLVGVFGLPATLLLFLTEYLVVGILTAVIVVGVLGAVTGMYWLLTRENFTMLNVEKTLRFQDANASQVAYVDARSMRANHKGLTEVWFKDVGPEDVVNNVQIDGSDPDLQDTLVDGQKKQVGKRYAEGLQWRQVIEATMSLTYNDRVFTDPESGYFTHKVMDKTKRIQVRLEFDRNKRAHDIKVLLGYGGARGEVLGAPQIRHLENRRVWVWERKKPKPGENYRLEWDWS